MGNKSERPILGEKGIGRLAIASIGPQVLVITKAKRTEGLHDLVATFINWSLFELPGIDLDQIIVPMRTFSNDNLPGRDDIKGMVEEVISNVNILESQEQISIEVAEKLIKQLNAFDLDPKDMDEYLGEPSLTGEGHGTHFYILPADDMLQLSIDGDKSGNKASPLRKMLMGFTNTMTPDAKEPNIIASFRDHKTDGIYDELISYSDFFTPEEFRMADHHLKGVFDEYGQFKGTVTVFGEEPNNHIIPWNGSRGKKTSCGPFKINVAYIQGTLAQTKLPPDEFALIFDKVNNLGGLYIYKDDIRILPYGDSDYDFLNIEKRRTLSAKYYFFSYRRMFGVIEISRENNPNLIEKAGREGFIENKAYRQFKEIGELFFVQLAADFFREGGGPKSEFWDDTRKELKRLHEAKKEYEKKATAKKNKLIEDLERFFQQIQQGEPQRENKSLLDTLERDLKIASEMTKPDESSQAFLNAESSARKKLDNLRETYKVVRSRFVMGKKLQFDWDAYLNEVETLGSSLFIPTYKRIEEIIQNAENEYNFSIDRRRRLEQALNEIIDDTRKTTSSETREIRESLNEVSNKVIALTKEIIVEMEDDVKEVMSDFAKVDISEMDDANLVLERSKLESKIISEAERNKEILKSIQAQLDNITWTQDEMGDIITSVDITEAIEDELISLRERADQDLELSQLGLAIGVIHHEFSGTVKSIRKSIRELKAWADLNENLSPLYADIRANFEHLDGYLTLFTPLNRRLYRKEVEISGNEIKKFIEDIFSERIKRHNIDLESSSAFLKKNIIGYPSTFYPVFVNIVDNAIFWLKDHPLPRKIVFDADEMGFSISNNGPEISSRDYEIIFEQGFTRKPSGRGLGLYISKEVLSKVGYRICVVSPLLEKGVTFRIEPIQNQNFEGE